MDLYAVRTVKKDGTSLHLKVYEVYADGEDRFPQPDARFMLSVIAEHLGPLNKRLNLLPPLGQEIIKHKPFKNASDFEAMEHFTGKLMRMKPTAYITEVKVLEENIPAEKPTKAIFQWKFSERTGLFKEDEAKIPWVLFEVVLSDAKWADHLKVGKLMGTAEYFG
jgi:hypothetical protein